MRRGQSIGVFMALLAGVCASTAAGDEPDWAINMANIEACSCKMFCTCYFSMTPTPGGEHQHAGMKFCRFNNAFKINTGNYGDTKLDGIKFWMAGDLGSDYSKGFDWAVITFEPEATPQQRDAVKAIVKHVFIGAPFKSFTDGKDAKIDWSADKDQASAKLDDGKAAEIELKRTQGNTDDPVTINNVKFWAAPRNDGFKLMQNEVEAYRLGDKPFEFKGTDGFVTTIDMTSKDVK